MKKTICLAISLAALAGFAAPTTNSLTAKRLAGRTPAPATAPATGAEEPKDAHSLNFNNAPVELVFDAIQAETGRTILKDPACPNPQITLKTREGQKLDKNEYLEAIYVILEMYGVHLENYGEKFIRALPRNRVRKDGIPLILDPTQQLGEEATVVSMMIEFKYIAIEDAQKVLENFKSETGVLLGLERANSILATDTKLNINRMLEIAEKIDVATPVLENVFVRQIEYANAQEIKTALEAIVQESQKELEKSKGAQQAAANPPRPRLFTRPNGANNQPAPTPSASQLLAISDADRGMIRGKVLILADERSNKLIIVTQQSNMDFFDKVIKQLDIETTPDTVVKVYRLKYAEAEEVSDMINDLIGNAASSKNSSKQNQNQNSRNGTGGNITRNTTPAAKSANQRTGEAKAGELSKENTTVLADQRINGLVVMTNKELVPVIEQIIEKMDIKLSQVLIETVIIEVGLGDDLSTGIDWVQRGKHDTMVNRNSYMLGGGGGSGGDLLKAAMGVATNMTDSVFGPVNPIGSGVNYFLKSDKLNLAAVIEASKSDNRTKYLASPVVMTVDNKEAIINATTLEYLLKGFQTSGSSYFTMAVPDYEQKDVGIEIKVTPKINPNGTVMLSVELKYSQVTGTTTIQSPSGSSSSMGGTDLGSLVDVQVPITSTREMSADVILENMQTVIFGGLTDNYMRDEETGIPILKDIPWVGKWLFGSVKKEEKRKELLVFMTPYVLDDAEAAQAEALRRKRTLSDSRSWEDHGWSLSPLADPVSKKEQIRRLKDEWKVQDEERKTRLAIEKMKVERIEKLKGMSDDEREHWLKLHRDELEGDARKDFEVLIEDGESQEDMIRLAEKIRESKLAEADRAINANTAEYAGESERAKLEAEKQASEAEAK